MHDIHACPDCDLLQQLPELTPGAKARCARCGCTLASRPSAPIERPLALAIAALFVLIVANTAPLMGLSVVGRHASTTILGGCYRMWVEGEPATALVVAFCATVAPAVYVAGVLTILIAARHPPAPRWVGRPMRWAETMQPWAMIEVMMLGILVALVKIAELATVQAGIGMYAVGILVFLIPAIAVTFDPQTIWERIAWTHDGPPPASPPMSSGPAMAREQP